MGGRRSGVAEKLVNQHSVYAAVAVYGRALIGVAERAPPLGAILADLDPHRRRDRVARPDRRIEHPDTAHQVVHRSRLRSTPDALAQGGPLCAAAEHVGAGLGAGDEIGQRPQLGSQFRHSGAAIQQLLRHLDGRKADITASGT
jgi:hypothetical protein